MLKKNCKICEFNSFQDLALNAKSWKQYRFYKSIADLRQQRIETFTRLTYVYACSEKCLSEAKQMRKLARELDTSEHKMLAQAVNMGREQMIESRRRYEIMLNFKNPNGEVLERCRRDYLHKKSVHTQRLRNLNHYVRKSNT